jgi:hypothetical protein
MTESDQTQDRILTFLSDPKTHGGQAPDRVDTHGAIIFLLPDRAYKLKRTVNYFFMDFSTVEKRQAACLNEIRLNRRTAPDLYHGTRAILEGADGLHLSALDEDPAGRLDTVIEMARFDSTFADQQPSDDELRSIAETIADFHEAEPALNKAGGATPLGKTLAGNIAMLEDDPACDQETLRQLKTAATEHLAQVSPLLNQRAEQGSVRHCHGDLHLANICRWHGKPTLFDCIEFNDAYAHIDILYDLAFLLMDLDAHDRREGAALVLNRYLERRPQDIAGLSLMPLFLSMRAQVRAKVGFAAAAHDAPDAGAKRRAVAGEYLDQALGYLTLKAPALIAIGGPSGSGKSTIARRVGPHIGAAPGALILRSDAIRKRLFNAKEETDRLPQAAYRATASEETYGEMERLCALSLSQGHSALADATFTHPGSRARIEAVAQKAGVPFFGFWLDLDEATAMARVAARKGDVSDATSRVVAQQFKTGWGQMAWQKIAATDPMKDQVAAILNAL